MARSFRALSALLSYVVVVVVLVLVAVVWSADARADLRDECASASERGQQFRAQGKLVEARVQLLGCSRQACPVVVKDDCERMLSQVDASLPSIVVTAKDPDSNDAIMVRVLVDGTLVRERLDGLGITLNPGVHDLRFELAGSKPQSMHVLVPEAQKNRPVAVAFESLIPGAHGVRSATEGPGSVALPAARRASPLAYVLSGVGVAGLGAFAYFQVRAVADSNHLRTTCAPRCSQSEVDGVSNDVVAAHVSLVGGLVAGALATTLFIVAPWPSSSGAAALAVGPGSVGWRVSF